MEQPDIIAAFSAVKGMKVSGIHRTHGSAIFLEFGNLIKRREDAHPHGEIHFLSQLTFWRLIRNGRLIVGSESSKSEIDFTFTIESFGTVRDAWLQDVSSDITIKTSTELIIEFSWFGWDGDGESTVWTLFKGDKESWSLMTSGQVIYEEA